MCAIVYGSICSRLIIFRSLSLRTLYNMCENIVILRSPRRTISVQANTTNNRHIETLSLSLALYTLSLHTLSSNSRPITTTTKSHNTHERCMMKRENGFGCWSWVPFNFNNANAQIYIYIYIVKKLYTICIFFLLCCCCCFVVEVWSASVVCGSFVLIVYLYTVYI